jgi:hypothetical protein
MDYEKLLDAAHEAAKKACEGIEDDPSLFDCGFAWVVIDGRDPLAAHCRKVQRKAGKLAGNLSESIVAIQNSQRRYGTRNEPGWRWWCPGDYKGQSIRGHEAAAKGFMSALTAVGIRATLMQRLD